MTKTKIRREYQHLETERQRKPLPGESGYNPISDLPKPFRKLVGWLWAFYGDVLPNPVSLAIRVKTFAAKDGLTPDDLKSIAEELCTTEAASTIQFASQFHAHFARLAADIIRRRRTEKEMRERREAIAEAKAQTDQISIADEMKKRIASKGIDG